MRARKKKLSTKRRAALVKRRAKPLLGMRTAAAVAKFLRAKRIQGRPGEASHCPLANYLNYGCAVSGGFATVEAEGWEANVPWDADEFDIRLGVGCSKFVSVFDYHNGGIYPDLVGPKRPKRKRK